jgi:threonine/homoserine/homoserine lactone efflux protein
MIPKSGYRFSEKIMLHQKACGMTIAQSLLAYTLAAGLLTITPGFDTILVLRTATAEGAKQAALAGLGVCVGCLCWGAIVAIGLGALLTASHVAYEALKLVGAAYLAWLGLNLLLRPRTDASFDLAETQRPGAARPNWFWRGLLGNLLNPKVGAFYVSFLPLFVPAEVPVGPYIFLLAAIHAALGVAWFAALIMATQTLGRALRRPRIRRTLDVLVGCIFIGMGVKLALSRQ